VSRSSRATEAAGEAPLTGAEALARLPAAALHSQAPISQAFRAHGCVTLRAAAEHIWRLPYGRNARPDDRLCVLDEGRGTCSTKHALLARLLAEEGVEGFELRLGIYEMNEANTPGVGRVLAAHGLPCIPEAHCYLASGAARIDLTRVEGVGGEPVQGFVVEEAIAPDQIGEYKRAFHRRYLAEAAASGAYGSRTADDLWAIREECIAALVEVP
jgi:hypothetical protein